MEERDQPDWDISRNRERDAEASQLTIDYRNAWNEKWQIVKTEICKHHDAILLDQITCNDANNE